MALEQAGIQLIAQGANAFNADLKGAEKSVAGFGASVSKSADLIQDAAGRWRTASGKFATDAEKAAQGVATVTPAAKKAGDATKLAGEDAEKGGRGFHAFGEVVTGALRKVGELAVSAMAQAAQATAAFVGDSISKAGDFEAGMNKFRVVAGQGVDTKGLEEFKDLFLSLGKELPVSTSEVQQAAIEMVSGGIDPAIVAAGALRQTIQFAAASGLSLADAAATSAKFLAGWTSSAATTEEKVAFLATSTDELTKAAAASSTTAAELRLGLFNAQGSAQLLGVSFKDVTATLALLAPSFQSSAQAGTALNVFMSRLVPTTQPATDAMEKLGLMTTSTGQLMTFLRAQGIEPLGTDIDTLGDQFDKLAVRQHYTAKQARDLWAAFDQSKFFDAQGNFAGMSNAAQLLKESLSGLSDAEKIESLQAIFGNDAKAVANALMKDGSAALAGMISKMDAANGVEAAAALMQEGYNTALDNAKGSVEALKITIGLELLPVLTDLMNNVLAPGVNIITDLAGSGDIATKTFAGLSPVMQQVALTAKMLFDAFESGDFSAIIAGIVSDIGDALPGIDAQLAAWGDAFVAWIAPMIPPMLAELGEIVDAAMAWVVAQVPSWEQELAAWGDAFVAWIAPMIPPALDALDELVVAAGAWIVAQAPSWERQLAAWGDALVAWIAPMIPPAIEELGNLALAFFGWVGDQAAPLLATFVAWKDAFIDWIPGATITFLAEWPKMFDQFLTWIGNEAGPLLRKFGDWAVAMVAWIIPMIPGFLAKLALVALALGVFIVETGAVLYDKIVNVWAPALVRWVLFDALPKLLIALFNLGKGIYDWIARQQTELAIQMRRVGESMVTGIRDGLSNAWSSLTSWISDKVHSLVGAALSAIGAGSPARAFMPVGQSMVTGMMQGFMNEWPAMTQMVGELSTDLIDQMKRMGASVSSALAGAFTGTATMDRQIADNMTKIAGMADAATQAQLTYYMSLERKNATDLYSDPTVAAQYFKMVSDHWFELFAIRENLANAATAADRTRYQTQENLIISAQNLERQAFEQQQSSGGSIASLITEIQRLMYAPDMVIGPTFDALAAFLAQLQSVPRLASGGPAQAGKPYWVGEDGPELFWPTMNGTVMPAASSAQLMNSMQTTNNNQQTSYSMPIYTNNSPSALQQSMAVMRAGMI